MKKSRIEYFKCSHFYENIFKFKMHWKKKNAAFQLFSYIISMLNAYVQCMQWLNHTWNDQLNKEIILIAINIKSKRK